MFGGKFKTWMEAHIGRPKKKTRDRSKEVKTGKVLVESSESLAHSDTGISSGSIPVLSSTTDGHDDYCSNTIDSVKGNSQARTVHLSSPESAYSTGYSTDGGEVLHPEYYINIRTGKHYFPSPAPTPTSPNPHPLTCITTSFLSADTRIAPLTTFPSWLAEPPSQKPPPPPIRCDSYKSPRKTDPKSPLSSFKFFLKSPKQDKVKPKAEVKPLVFESKKSPTKCKKWYKQPFKFGNRTEVKDEKRFESLDEIEPVDYAVPSLGPAISHELPPPQYNGEAVAASPRQRNRIRTNPWIPKEAPTTHTYHQLQLSFPPILRNRSCTNTPLQQRKTPDDPPFVDQFKDMTLRYENSRDYLASFEKAVNNHISKKFIELSDQEEEEDLTMNEMMGTFNESYVYEKETDILSDSDPTDCEDYVSDSEAIHGGDEDSHDDELDFIDTGSLAPEEDLVNTGRCSYHEFSSRKSFLYRNRTQNSLDVENRKNSRKEKEAKKRRREEKKRRSLRKVQAEQEGSSIERKVGGSVNLRKVLLQRMLSQSCSKSAESSPVGLRRKQLPNNLRESYIGSPNNANKCEYNLLSDAEADKKYNELIQEAEIMLESLKNTPVLKKRMAELPKRESPRKVHRSPRKASPKIDRNRETPRRSPKNLGLKLSVGNQERPGDDGKRNSFRAKSSAHSPLDPLGPTFRNFSVFKPPPPPKKKISSSSSDDSETTPAVPQVPSLPFGFQFVEFGRPSLASHCPQSEPVKRKMYACSKTYDRLMRTFDVAGSSPQRSPAAFYNPTYSPVPTPPKHQGRRGSTVAT